MSRRVLVIEDDKNTADALTELLISANYQVNHASSREQAFNYLSKYTYQLLTIDIMLGHEKNAGINIISYISQNNLQVPLLVISGMDPTIYSDITLNMIGVWDFISKPYDGPSLLTKINRLVAHQQEMTKSDSTELHYKDLILNIPYPSRSSWKNHKLNLTLTQCRLLALLIENKGKPVSYKEFYKVIESGRNTSNVRAHIKKIRELFKSVDSSFSSIQAVPGVGYLLEDKVR